MNISFPKAFIYIVQLMADFNFHSYVYHQKQRAFKVSGGRANFGWIYIPGLYLLYLIIRHFKPKVVIETGVGPGGSTAYILKALKDNNKGKLWSIDLPVGNKGIFRVLKKYPNAFCPEKWEAGWLVPGWLKDGHQLIIGDAKEELPKLLRKIGRVDVFLHDSLHTDKQVMAELEVVFPQMSKRGLIICDDVDQYWGDIQDKFCQKNKISFVFFQERIGIGRLD